ncbi:MAG TPA: oxygenase MpaB family protein [Solirubrobacteraceae bacterium]|jgi:hypothetical protein
MSAATRTPRSYELGQQADPEETVFVARLEDLPETVDRDLARRMLQGLWESDQPADDVVVEFSQLRDGSGWQMLDRALTDGMSAVPEMPPALRAMLEPILEPPEWVNWELFEAGRVAHWRAGPAVAVGGALSLGYGYPIPRIAKVLLGTGRIDRSAGKRLLETGQWILAATAPENMRPDRPGSGIAASIRVRLVHAFVRRHMLAQDDWNLASDGIPLNVTDTAATLSVAFFALHVQSVRKLGIRYSPGETEAMAHMWRWLGHVMGIPHDLQPLSYRRATDMHEIYDALDQRTDPESGKTLTAALVRHGLPQVAFGIPASRANDLALLTVPFTSALLGYMLGSEAARLVGLGRNPLTPAMRAAPLAGHASNVLRAAGLLGSDAAIARTSHGLAARLLTKAGSPASPVHPEAAVSESRDTFVAHDAKRAPISRPANRAD